MKLRHSNRVDLSRVFSASIRGGIRGIDDDTMALETHSNDICPTIRTISGWVVICEPNEDRQNNSFESEPE